MNFILVFLVIGLLFASIYCLSQKKFLGAIILAIFLYAVILIQHKYVQHTTVENFELLDNALHITYQNQRQVTIPYTQIKELRHYCEGGRGSSKCGVNIYTQQEKLQLGIYRSNFEDAKQLKAKIYQKMHK